MFRVNAIDSKVSASREISVLQISGTSSYPFPPNMCGSIPYWIIVYSGNEEKLFRHCQDNTR